MPNREEESKRKIHVEDGLKNRSKNPSNAAPRGLFIAGKKNPFSDLGETFGHPKTFGPENEIRGGKSCSARIHQIAPRGPLARWLAPANHAVPRGLPGWQSGWTQPNGAAPRGKATCVALTAPGQLRAHVRPIMWRHVARRVQRCGARGA